MERGDLDILAEDLSAPGLEYYYPGGNGAVFWKTLRRRSDVASDIAEIMSEGERLLLAPAEELNYTLFSQFEARGSRLEYERVYFEKRRRLNTFAILSLLEPETKAYEQELLNAVWSLCSEFTWCLPAHVDASRPVSETIDLFSAETGFALAELRLLFGERLPDLLRDRIAEMVDARLFRPFLEKGPYEWEEAEHNWAAVCAGSIGSAALLLLEEERDRDRLIRILAKTERSMSFYLQGFGADGACLEGLGYWNYGFGYFVYYAELLRKRSGGKRDWFRQDKVRRIACFQQKCFLGGSLVANFSDTLPHGSVHLGLSHYLAGQYAEVEVPPASLRADFREDHCSRWAHAIRNLIWRDRSAARTTDWQAGDFYLDDAGWLVSRVSNNEGTFGFAAKGGHNGEPHNHNDLGHFMLSGKGGFLLSDLGCGEYTRDYFGEGRYAYVCNSSQGHSVPMIGGQLQSAGQERTARVLERAMEENECRLSLELSAAYECKNLDGFKRCWVWRKNGLPSLNLLDEFRFAEVPEMLTERFVTPIKPEYADLGRMLLSSGSLALEVHFDGERLRPEVTERTYLDHFGKETVWFTLDFHVFQPKPVMEINFQFQFVNI